MLSCRLNIQAHLDNRKFVAGVFVDLENLSIQLIMIYSLENLITIVSKGSQRSGLKEFVAIEDEISSAKTVLTGTPQGSVLGRLLV